jgi:tetratricopeptide (TPR) repeat protein
MYSRFFIFLFLLSINAIAQTYKIDSLKKLLPALTDRANVDCLNDLGWQYYYYQVHSDSAFKYTNIAYQKASAINYNSGKAESLIIKAGVEGTLLGHPDAMLRYSQQALEFAKKENDLKTLSAAYYSLAMAYAIKGMYEPAHNAAAKAKQIAVKANDKSGLGWAKEASGFIYSKSGEYWKAFEYFIESQEMGKELNDSLLTSMSLSFIGRAFNRAGDPQKALAYYYESLKFAIPFQLLWPHLEDMAYAHLQLKQYDSVFYYQQKHRDNLNSLTSDSLVRKKFSAQSWGFSVDIQFEKKQYDLVIAQILPELNLLRKNRDVIPLMQALLLMGKAYAGKSNYQTALLYNRELYQLAHETNNRQFLKESYNLFASSYENLRQSDSAYFYFKQYIVIRDSMETKQYAGRTALYLASSEAENRIRLLKKDKEIKDQQLVLNKKELQKQSQLRNLLGAGLFLLLLFSILVFRNIILKRKNEKLQYEQEQLALKRKALELEMQALRAQMNPHFIFNCLSAIDNLIQTSQSDKATAYLSRFAKLIRSVLGSSKNNLVPFQKDFETLRLYLEMEQFRCNNKFNYLLNADDELLSGDYKVPPMIVQPFIENAIHHWLLNKQDSNRQLQVTAQLKNEQIIYSITDNGIGRKKAAILKERNRPGQESYGIAITTERIHLHNKNGIEKDIFITDLEQEGFATGTKAEIRINNSE